MRRRRRRRRRRGVGEKEIQLTVMSARCTTPPSCCGRIWRSVRREDSGSATSPSLCCTPGRCSRDDILKGRGGLSWPQCGVPEGVGLDGGRGHWT